MFNLYRKHRLLVSIAGGLFVLVLIVILSRCTQIGKLISPTSQELDTPGLIDQALARGEINEEERLLYLAYALHEYESLPARFRGNVGWRATSVVAELYEAVNTPSIICSMSLHVRSELLRLVKTKVNTICK